DVQKGEQMIFKFHAEHLKANLSPHYKSSNLLKSLCVGIAIIFQANFVISAHAADYDLIIENGRVMDPETGLDAIRNVGIKDGVITAITRKNLKGENKIDAAGHVVAPGFIDLQAHGQHLFGQQLQVQDGVTTALEMEAGAYPIKRFLSRREGQSLIHYGATVNHVCLRAKIQLDYTCTDLIDEVNGDPEVLAANEAISDAFDAGTFESLTRDQISTMVGMIEKEVEDGALGVGLLLEYTPGAGRDEIFYIFEEAGKYGAPIFVHVRRRPLDDAPGVPIAVVQEVIANAAVTGAPLQIVHIVSTGLKDTPVIVDMVGMAQEKGLDITAEQYPYTAGGNVIGTNMLSEGWRKRFDADYSDIIWSDTGERLTEETFHKLRKEQPDGAIILDVIPEDAVNYAMAHPAVSIASDGMPWRTGQEHPRGTGTFARVLGKYVREDQVLDLMTALRKMSLMPAQRMEKFAPIFEKKGRIQEGAHADITIFDPETVIDRATFSEPTLTSIGIPHVLVNGVFVVRDGELVENVYPGQGLTNKLAN
ncbi:MAG: amidohydrolase family protein, partial [Pseudomonadota bacterium]